MSRHFTMTEFLHSTIAAERGLGNTPGEEERKALGFTMAGLERIRACLGKPIRVTSGFRSYELNLAIGGAKNSQHMRGEAVDFICPEFGSPFQIAHQLAFHMELLGIDQLIQEGTWVHASFTLEPRYSVLTFRDGKYLNGIV